MKQLLTKKYLFPIFAIAAFFSIWSIVTSCGLVKPIFLPSPKNIYLGILELLERGWLQKAIFLSVMRVVFALFIVTILGTAIGSIMGLSNTINLLLNGLVSGIKSIPVTGLLGLIVLWFSIEEKAKVVFLVIGSLFYMIILVRDAIENAKKTDYIDIARDYGATKFQIFSKVLFPAAMPQIFNAIIVSNSLMWTYIVLAEYINGNEEQTGLGYLIYISSRTQDSAKVFGLLIIIAIIASITDLILKLTKRKFIKWS